MDENATRVLKKDAVKLAGTPQVDPGVAARSPGSIGAAARVVRHEGNTTIVEVACACGRTIELHCDWMPDSDQSAPPAEADASQPPVTS